MNEIMTMEEVADRLGVSERTILEWIDDGSLHGVRSGTTWRFKRAEVERRAELRRPAENPETNLLTSDRVVLLDSADKRAVLERLVERLARSPLVTDSEALLRGILDREALMSTGIGFGVAVPHVRIDSVKGPVMAVAVCKTSIPDYASLDDQPVRIVCMVAARSDQHKEYIRTLAKISSHLKRPDLRERILESADASEICNLLIEED